MDHVNLAVVPAVDGSANVSYPEFGLIAGGMIAALLNLAMTAAFSRGIILSLLLLGRALPPARDVTSDGRSNDGIAPGLVCD